MISIWDVDIKFGERIYIELRHEFVFVGIFLLNNFIRKQPTYIFPGPLPI